jgi:hypothetical protein
MYAQSSLLLCNTSESRWCVDLKAVSTKVCLFAPRRILYLAGLECSRERPATCKLEHGDGSWVRQQCRLWKERDLFS